MMTSEEFRLLCSAPVRDAIAENRGRDPLVVALDRRIPEARLVATQLKYLARAATKLPSYAAAGCILPPRAFEQASSEACAAHKPIAGDRLLDLTCGLGVDTLFLSRRFREVVALERDPVLADVARENFARLGVANVEVVAASAEEFIARSGLHFDWIYADPDRRSAEGRKLVRLEACSPDVLALRPRLREIAPRICLKNSPLFDVDEALRLFPASRVEVVSLAGECKEVMIYDDGTGPSVTATALGLGSFTAVPRAVVGVVVPRTAAGAAGACACAGTEAAGGGMPHSAGRVSDGASEVAFDGGSDGTLGGTADGAFGGAFCEDSGGTFCEAFAPDRYRWLAIPDVALQKGRLVRRHLAGKADCWSENGYGFAAERPEGVLGRLIEIERIEPFDPRTLRRELKGCGVEVLKRDFPTPIEELRRRLGVRAGDTVRIALTKIAGRSWVIRLK